MNAKLVAVVIVVAVVFATVAIYLYTQSRDYYPTMRGKLSCNIVDVFTSEGISGIISVYGRHSNFIENIKIENGRGFSNLDYRESGRSLYLRFDFSGYLKFWKVVSLWLTEPQLVYPVEAELCQEPIYEISAVDQDYNEIIYIDTDNLRSPYVEIMIRIRNTRENSAWVGSYNPLQRIFGDAIFYVKLEGGDFQSISVESELLEKIEERKEFPRLPYVMYYGDDIQWSLDDTNEDNFHFLIYLDVKNWDSKYRETTVEYGIVLYSSTWYRRDHRSWGVEAVKFENLFEVR